MSKAESYDVTIFGGGPSGASTAIFLAQSGFSVSIVTRKAREDKRIGESLSPQSSIVLKQLGLWEAFLKDGHLPCHGNKSAWGSSELELKDSICNAYGHGWHIDRLLFERRLLERVRALGARIIQSDSPPRLSHKHGSWTLDFDSPAESIRTRFLVHYICDSYSRCYPVFFVRVTPADRRGSLVIVANESHDLARQIVDGAKDAAGYDLTLNF